MLAAIRERAYPVMGDLSTHQLILRHHPLESIRAHSNQFKWTVPRYSLDWPTTRNQRLPRLVSSLVQQNEDALRCFLLCHCRSPGRNPQPSCAFQCLVGVLVCPRSIIYVPNHFMHSTPSTPAQTSHRLVALIMLYSTLVSKHYGRSGGP